MNQNFENITAIRDLATGQLSDYELTFTAPEVLEAITLSTANGIAVLGIEIFEIRSEQYLTKKMSGYEIGMSNWDQYVSENNRSAEEFVLANELGPNEVYVLTTVSTEQSSKMTNR